MQICEANRVYYGEFKRSEKGLFKVWIVSMRLCFDYNLATFPELKLYPVNWQFSCGMLR